VLEAQLLLLFIVEVVVVLLIVLVLLIPVNLAPSNWRFAVVLVNYYC
jgi:hypothetical protein